MERGSNGNLTLEKNKVIWKCRREDYACEEGESKWSDDGVMEREKVQLK